MATIVPNKVTDALRHMLVMFSVVQRRLRSSPAFAKDVTALINSIHSSAATTLPSSFAEFLRGAFAILPPLKNYSLKNIHNGDKACQDVDEYSVRTNQ
jgi:hypothetical protein